MAKQVKLKGGKDFVFRTGSAKQSKYPWDQWLNGDLLLLEQSAGEKDDKDNVTKISEKRDYEVSTDAMPGKLKGVGRRRYKNVQVSRLDANGDKLKDALIIRASDMTADERQAEDIRRAEEKANRKAKGDATPAAASRDEEAA